MIVFNIKIFGPKKSYDINILLVPKKRDSTLEKQ